MMMRRLVESTPIHRFLRAEDGTTAIEYAMIASGISIAILASLTALGSGIKTNFYDKLAALF